MESASAATKDRPHRWSFKRIALLVIAAPFVLIVAVLLFLVLVLVLLGHFLQAMFLAMGVFLFHRGFVEYRHELTVRNLPTSKASSAAVGLVELVGRGRADTPVAAPVSGRLSAYWTVAVEEYYSGKNGGWRQVAYCESTAGMLQIEDDTGRMPIWPNGAEFALDATTWNSKDGPPPEGGARLLTEFGKSWPASSANAPMRIVETRIEEGAPLYVLGTVSERRQIPAKFERPAVSDATTAAVTAGRADQVRQALVVKVAGHFGVSPDTLYPPTIDPERLLMWRGDKKRAFVIAVSQERALARLSSSAKWLVAVGAGLIAIALITYLV